MRSRACTESSSPLLNPDFSSTRETGVLLDGHDAHNGPQRDRDPVRRLCQPTSHVRGPWAPFGSVQHLIAF